MFSPWFQYLKSLFMIYLPDPYRRLIAAYLFLDNLFSVFSIQILLFSRNNIFLLAYWYFLTHTYTHMYLCVYLYILMLFIILHLRPSSMWEWMKIEWRIKSEVSDCFKVIFMTCRMVVAKNYSFNIPILIQSKIKIGIFMDKLEMRAVYNLWLQYQTDCALISWTSLLIHL